MGTWGCGTFDSDEALDWSAALLSKGISEVIRVLEAALPNSGGAVDCTPVPIPLAACEVVAGLVGRASPHLPAEVADWIAAHGVADENLVRLALAVVEAVRTNDQLKHEWFRTADFRKWSRGITQLRERLSEALDDIRLSSVHLAA